MIKEMSNVKYFLEVIIFIEYGIMKSILGEQREEENGQEKLAFSINTV